MSSSTRERIIALAGQGVQQSVIASSCGVTPAYVSQLLELEDVREEVAVLRAETLENSLKSDKAVDDVEMRAREIVLSKLPWVKTAGEAAKIFQIFNNAHRKAIRTDQDSDARAVLQVNIVLPRAASIMLETNELNQVVAVQGRTMAPLTSKALQDMAAHGAARRRAEATDVKVLSELPPKQSTAQEFKQRQQEKDKQQAAGVLKNLEVMHNGVQVVL